MNITESNLRLLSGLPVEKLYTTLAVLTLEQDEREKGGHFSSEGAIRDLSDKELSATIILIASTIEANNEVGVAMRQGA